LGDDAGRRPGRSSVGLRHQPADGAALTRETYGRGYIALDDLKDCTRAAPAEVAKGERVTGKPCAG
jgi:hypothetical protein